MDPCRTYADWSAQDDRERLRSLTEVINRAIREWGFDPVRVVSTPAFADPQHALSIAYHEALRAILDQAGVDIEDLAEELAAGFLGARAADESLEGCACGEPVDGSGDGSAPPFPFRCDLEGGSGCAN